MWPMILKSLAGGLAFGWLVGFFNHWLMWSVLKDVEKYPVEVAKRKLMVRFFLRQMINLMTIATYLYHKNVYILAGTAVGLILRGKILAVKNFFQRKG